MVNYHPGLVVCKAVTEIQDQKFNLSLISLEIKHIVELTFRKVLP